MDNTPKIVGAGHSPGQYAQILMKKQMGRLIGQRASKLHMAQRKLYKQLKGRNAKGMPKWSNMYGNVQIANPKTWEDRNRANQGTKLNK